MKKRERIISAIKLKAVDKIPSTYRGTKHVNIMLYKYFGYKNYEDCLLENYKELLENIGADIWSSGSKISAFGNFVPEYIGSPPYEPYAKDRDLFYTIGINSINKKIKDYEYDFCEYGVDPPLNNVENVEDLKKDFLMPKLELFNFNNLENRYFEVSIQEILEDEDEFVCIGTLSSIFMICCYLRGMNKFLMDLALNERLAEFIIKSVGEFCIEFCKKELEASKGKADYYGTWDDVAGQDGLMFSPEVFKKYFLPIYKEIIGQVKKHNIFFGWHCCGSVNEVLPYMVDAGIDVFDVAQTSAKDMDLNNLHKLYGKKICIHGAIDAQKLLVNMKPSDIKEEVKRAIGLWGERGGLILAPSHLVTPDTPIENVLALYEAIND